MGKSRVVIATVVATLASASVLAAVAEWKPEKPIEIIVGTGVGGGQDKSARTVQRILQEGKLVEQPVTVVNKPGAGTNIGAQFVAGSKPDGYTMLMIGPSFTSCLNNAGFGSHPLRRP